MKRTAAERQAFCEGAAARMTANPTTAEARLWEVLEPLGFERQVPYCGSTKNGGEWSYILDFFHWDHWLCIEVDGSIHDKQRGRDRRRDSRLAQEEIKTVRIANYDVLHHLDKVTEQIAGELRERA
jgi:very-short-patch-repair endonuclease